MLQTGELLVQPGLVQTLEALAEEGAESVYRGSVAEALLRLDGVVFTADDLRSYSARWADPVLVGFHEHRVATRGGLSGVPELLPRFPRLSGLSASDRILELVTALETPDAGRAHDEHGRRRRARPRLRADPFARRGRGRLAAGLRSPAEQPPRRVGHRVRAPQPGDHLQSRMAPSLVFDDSGLALAIGAAGATRLKTALSTALAGVLDEGLDPEEAVSRPCPPHSRVVDAEPGVDESALEELEVRGRTVRRWEALHHYFGGVSCVAERAQPAIRGGAEPRSS